VIAAILERDTAVVALPNVHWTDGWRIHLEPISDTCRQVGALLCLDLTQSLGMLTYADVRMLTYAKLARFSAWASRKV
jgi:selenocysteine lyase/cysteine desulfurase